MSLTLAPKLNAFISTGDFFFVDVNVRKGFDNKMNHEQKSSDLLRYTSRLVQYVPSSQRLSYPILNENFKIDIPCLLFQLYLPIDRKTNMFSLTWFTNDKYMIHKSCHEVAETNIYFYASSESVVDIVFVHHLLELQGPKPVLCTGVKNTSFIAHCISFAYENEKTTTAHSSLSIESHFSFSHLLFKTMLQSYNYRIFTNLQVISDYINIALYSQRQYIRTVFSQSFNFPHEAFCYLCGKLDKGIIKETKLSRVRLLWWPDLSIEKVRFDNQQFTNIHLSTMNNLKKFCDTFGKSFGVGVKKS